jgi:acetyl-CoA carboxylase carboxyl transferase subunit beta
MKAEKCESCQKRKGTVHLTIMGSSAEVSEHHYCESCYSVVEKERLRWHSYSTGVAQTSLPTTAKESPIGYKPKIGRKTRTGQVPKGHWILCKGCATKVSDEALSENLNVCPHCQFHFRIRAHDRILALVEKGSFQELNASLISGAKFTGPLGFKSTLKACRRAKDAVVTGIATIGAYRVGLGVLDFSFLNGSMGSVVGEKLARLVEKCTTEAWPVIIISASCGARLQEGVLSLTQMAKTCGALARHCRAKLPYISVLTDLTMEGVLASFAGIGGLILAEPGARIGFAGDSVIKGIERSALPRGFQTAEFLLDRGLIDAIVPRQDMKHRLIDYLEFTTPRQKMTRAAQVPTRKRRAERALS